MSKLVVNAGDALSYSNELCDWLREHGIDPLITYKIEVNDDTLTIWQYELNSEGNVKINGHEAAKKDPFTIDIRHPLPEDIWAFTNQGAT